MTKALNKGFGECKMEATAKIVAPIALRESEQLHGFAATILAAVHAYNRHAPQDDFIALDFPKASYQREFAGTAGSEARFIGSYGALKTLLDSDRIKQYRRRTVSQADELITKLEPVLDGYAVVRQRATDRVQPGELRRRIRRCFRNGKPTAALEERLAQVEASTCEERRLLARVRAHMLPHDTGNRDASAPLSGPELKKAPAEFAIFLGEKPMMFARRRCQRASGNNCFVSTYGASDVRRPVIFDKWIEQDSRQNFTKPDGIRVVEDVIDYDSDDLFSVDA